jgi:cobaltochelatase CobS
VLFRSTLIDGEILFLPGPLLDAVRHGEWFVGNEGDLANPGMATALNAILDRQPLTVLDNGGEVVPIHPRFRFFMTSNTKGAGDESGLYQGTRMQNAALRNRFCWAVADYPSPDEEKAILAKTTPELDDYLRNAMVAVAAESRRLYVGRTDDPDGGAAGGELEVVISTRTLIAWAEATWCARGFVRRGIKPHEYALDFVLGHSASATSRMALQEILQRHMGDVAWTASPQSTP